MCFKITKPQKLKFIRQEVPAKVLAGTLAKIDRYIENDVSNHPIFIDVETTGLGEKDRVIELAIIDLEGCVIVDTLVYTDRLICSDAQKVHGIRQEDLQDKPDFSQLQCHLMRLFNDRDLYFYNADFDVSMLLQSSTGSEDFNFLNCDVHCLMLDCAYCFGEWSDKYNDFKFVSLASACNYLGVEIGNTHRALDDAKLTLAIYKALDA